MSRAKQRLREKGIAANEVSASRMMHVPLSSLWIAPAGHALHLAAEARTRFDEGAPIGLLATVLEEERSDQVATLDRLLAQGIRTGRQAARKATAERAQRDPWARPMSPKKMMRAVDALADIATGGRSLARLTQVASSCFLIAAGDAAAESMLRVLPEPIAAAIRAARMGAK